MRDIQYVVFEIWKRFSKDDITGMAAQLSYFFLLSLFPFLIFLLTLIGFLPISAEQVLDLIRDYAPGNTMKLIEENIYSLMNQRSGSLLSAGIIGTLWAASHGINALMKVFNRAYETDENRSFILSRFIAIVLTVSMLLVTIIVLLLPVFGRVIGEFVFSFFGLSETFLQIWNALRWISSFLIMVVVLAILYKLSPDRPIPLQHAFPGAVFATVCWQLVSLAFSFYVENFGNFTAVYGSLGGVIVLMIWFYLSAMIIVIGGEINAILFKKNTRK